MTAVAGTPVAAGLLTACGTGYASDPDPLLPMLTAARVDAAAAGELADSGGDSEAARAVADVRRKHAKVLSAEIERLNRPLPKQHGEARPHVDEFDELATRLAVTRKKAVALAAKQDGYRAALVGSVAAGCSALRRLAPELGADEDAEQEEIPVRADAADDLDTETLDALRTALAAEYAADWVYSLVTAYLPGAFDDSVERGSTAHERLAQHTKELLTDADTDPVPPRPAYVPEHEVSDEDSAVRVVVTAEEDTIRSWRGVLARAGDHTLRASAVRALCQAAARVTPWRAEGDMDPVAVALPGTP